MAKFEVSYSRKVSIKPYETMHVGLMQEFDTDETTPRAAFIEVRNFVNKMIENEKYYLAYEEENGHTKNGH